MCCSLVPWSFTVPLLLLPHRVMQGLLYPLDTIRTRLAVCKTASYTGIMHSARRIWAEEGFTAFYRGGVTGVASLGWVLGRGPGHRVQAGCCKLRGEGWRGAVGKGGRGPQVQG